MDEVLRAEIVLRWRDRRRGELASAHTMANLAAQVRAVLGEESLAGALDAAAADERRHVEVCSEVLLKLGDSTEARGALPSLPPTKATDPHGRLLEEVVFLLCTGEMIAASLLGQIARRTSIPAVRECLSGIARDEARHGALGWRVLDALLEARPDLDREAISPQVARQVMTAVLAYEHSPRTTELPEALGWGLAPPAAAGAIAKRVVASQVMPRLDERGLWPSPPVT